MRDQIRSLIASIVEDARDPIPFEDIQSMSPSPRPGRGPLLAAAVFVVVVVLIGVVALLRPPADGGPVVTDPTTTTATLDSGPVVESGGLTAAPVRVGEIPSGQVLEFWETGSWSLGSSMISFGPGADWQDGGVRPQLTVVTYSTAGRSTLDPPQVLERLRASHGTVTELTVRGRPAFLVERPERDTGWTMALLVLESDELVSEVQAVGFDVADVLAAAQSLSSVDPDTARQEAIEGIGWDLQVIAGPGDSESYAQQLAEVDGVARVTLRTPWFASRALFFDAQESDPTPTTTVAASQTEDTVRSFELVEALVDLEDDADVETVAAAIVDLGNEPRIGFSPAVATSRTLAFLDRLLGGAELVHDEPPIYQPVPGTVPNFDTGDLGVDVPLHPATVDDDIPASVIDAMLSPGGFPRAAGRGQMDGPFFHLGRLDDDSRLFAAFGGAHPEYFVWHYTPSGAGGGSSGTGSSLAFYGYGVTGASSGPGGSHVFIGVPLNTAVYTYDLGGTRYQQQPIGGHGVLPVAAHSGKVTAYDQDGNLLGSWQR